VSKKRKQWRERLINRGREKTSACAKEFPPATEGKNLPGTKKSENAGESAEEKRHKRPILLKKKRGTITAFNGSGEKHAPPLAAKKERRKGVQGREE